MISSFDRDQRIAPHAFEWRGPASRQQATDWLKRHRWRVPEDLVAVWVTTGGGDMFETEEVLSPSATGDHDLEAVNQHLWEAGLPRDLLVFHAGLYLTAVEPGGNVLQVDPDTFEPIGAFASISDWYTDLRSEYASTYGLAVDSGS